VQHPSGTIFAAIIGLSIKAMHEALSVCLDSSNHVYAPHFDISFLSVLIDTFESN